MSKVLIIEDEVAIADLEKDYLELSGFEVETENDGVVAGVQINKGYSLVTVALIVIVTVVYEGKIIKLLRGKK